MAVNVTPSFMRNALKGARRGWKLIWVLKSTARECDCSIDEILNRPKTPTDDDYMYVRDICLWLSRFFNPILVAIADGKSDEEIIKQWIGLDKKETKKRILRDKEDLNELNNYKCRRKRHKVVYARTLSKNHDWNTVK